MMRVLRDGRAAPGRAAEAFWARPDVSCGDVVVETVGVWGGRPFNLTAHLQRLRRSADLMLIPRPDDGALRDDVRRILAAPLAGTAAAGLRLRILVASDGARMTTLDRIPPRPLPAALAPVTARWVTSWHDPATAAPKVMGYGPANAARRRARAQGADDALLIRGDGIVLETPTAGLAWVVGDQLRHPAEELGVVASTTVAVLAGMAARHGLRPAPGVWPVAGIDPGVEMVVASALRPLTRVDRIGQVVLADRGVTRLLDRALHDLRHAG